MGGGGASTMFRGHGVLRREATKAIVYVGTAGAQNGTIVMSDQANMGLYVCRCMSMCESRRAGDANNRRRMALEPDGCQDRSIGSSPPCAQEEHTLRDP